MSAPSAATVPLTAEAPTHGDERWLRAARRARVLSWLSLFWMTAEGIVGIAAGITAGSVALIGFGLSSAVEGLASVIVVWRFTGARTLAADSERTAQKAVAVSFWLLAPYIAFESLHKLLGGEHPQTSWVGVGLAVGSVLLMPLLGRAKQRLGAQLGSAATVGEGTQNVLCALLASAVLVGLLANTIAGAWWVDPLAGLFIAGVAVKEGRESWRGEGCCVPTFSEPAAAGDGGDGCGC